MQLLEYSGQGKGTDSFNTLMPGGNKRSHLFNPLNTGVALI